VVSQGFSVEPAQLTHAAAEFEVLAQEVRNLVAGTAALAEVDPGLFGTLPAASAALASFRQSTEEAVNGLRNVAMTLDEDVAAGLRATAASYLEAERANTVE
jgi:hypothetical protein